MLAAPGTSFTASPTYISITDVRAIAPWIDDLITPDNDTGFDTQLADSRSWLDEMILRNYRGGNVSLLGYHGFALDAWYTGGGRRTSLTNRWLFSALGVEPAPGDATNPHGVRVLRPLADLRVVHYQGGLVHRLSLPGSGSKRNRCSHRPQPRSM